MKRSIVAFSLCVSFALVFSACSSSTAPTGPNARLGAPASVDFGRVKVTQHRDTSLRFTNTGTDTLAITNQIFSSAGFSLADSTQSHLRIGPGGYQDVTMRFSPADSSSVTAVDSLVTNVGSTTIQLHGGGIPLLRHLVTVSAIDFGDTRIGLCQDSTLGARRDTLIAVHNTGNDTLRVYSASGADAFFSTSFTQVIGPGDSGWIRVDYCPRSTGAVRGRLAISSNADDSMVLVDLSGNGVAYTPHVGSTFTMAVYSLDSLRNATLVGIVPDTIESDNATAHGVSGLLQVGTSDPTYYKPVAGGDVMFYGNGVPTAAKAYFGSGWWTLPIGTHGKNVTLFSGDTMLGALNLHVEETASYVKDTMIFIGGVGYTAAIVQVVKAAKYGPVGQPNHLEYLGILYVPQFGYMAGVEYYMQSSALKRNAGFIRYVQSFSLR